MNLINNITTWLNDKMSLYGFDGFIIDCMNPNLQTNVCIQLLQKTNSETIILKKKDFNIDNVLKSNITIVNIDEGCDAFKYISESNHMAVSSFNKVEVGYIRPWNRFGLAADIFPLGNMVYKDIYSIANDLGIKYSNSTEVYSSDMPYTQEQLDWAININSKYNNILDNKEDPSKNDKWFSLSIVQKKIIAKLHQQKKITEHKSVDFVKDIYGIT
jgi:hypothetical protein